MVSKYWYTFVDKVHIILFLNAWYEAVQYMVQYMVQYWCFGCNKLLLQTYHLCLKVISHSKPGRISIFKEIVRVFSHNYRMARTTK